ncbi:hypothetical protein RRG08_043620 [Elysia crispata]|uniref:Uncharacterized protein n=1 Tax=Elysia crispata TaxID=231223 RepID=A0AAE1A680_9GAST|nr:hypothetical protein RRG08_043620 [Elysia crispata]
MFLHREVFPIIFTLANLPVLNQTDKRSCAHTDTQTKLPVSWGFPPHSPGSGSCACMPVHLLVRHLNKHGVARDISKTSARWRHSPVGADD